MTAWPDPNAPRSEVDRFLGKPPPDEPPPLPPIKCRYCLDLGGCPCGGDNPDCDACDGTGVCPGCGE